MRGLGLLAIGTWAGSGLLLSSCAALHGPDAGRVSEGMERRAGHPVPSPSARPALPAGVSLADGLSEHEAVTLALAWNADFQTDLAELAFARASLREAGQIRNPVLTLLFPWGPKQLEATLKWPFEALLLRPRRVAAAKLDADALVERLVSRGLALAADARVAHADALAARQRAPLASESARVRGEIADIAEARLRAGDVSAFEIGAARADRVMAEEERSRAEAEGRAAEDRLRSLLGLGEEGFVLASSPPTAGACPELAALLREGARRPDVRSAELALQAASKRAGLSRAEVFGFTAVADANQKGQQAFEAGPGLEAALPVLHWNDAAAARERAEVERARARYVAVQHHAAAEVREAHTRYEEAGTILEIWRAQVRPQREEELRQAHAQHDAGEQPFLMVLEAERRLLEARMREADSEAELRRAAARLEKSVAARLTCGGVEVP